jgi:hypothetical protein
MLIKSERAQTAAGKSRLTNHVFRGAENASIMVLRGTEEDISDAFRDARKRGSKFAVRHWIISPEFSITDEQALQVVDWLAGEFIFAPLSATVAKHLKLRADESKSDSHYHVLVNEVDPATGRILSSSQNYARHEKISRCSEIFIGHPVISGKHNDAVIAALRREGSDKIADDLENAFRSNSNQSPREAFTSSDHQRTARLGIDLPYLRSAVADIWKRTDNRASLEAALSDLSLVIAAGDRDGIYIVRTADGVFIGALNRLVRIRKAEVLERMEPSNAAAKPATSHQTTANNRASDLCDHESNPSRNETHLRTSDDGNGPTAPIPIGLDGPTLGDGRIGPKSDAGTSGGDPREAGRTANQKGNQRGRHRLSLELALGKYTEPLIDLLGRARKAAAPPAERVSMEIGEFLESQEAAKIKAAHGLSEPKALLDARQHELEASQKVGKLREAVCDAENVRSDVRSRRIPMLFGRTEHSARKRADEQKAQAQISELTKQLQNAERTSRDAESHRRRIERDYRADAAEFSRFWQAQAKYSDSRIRTAEFANIFVRKNPQFSRWGTQFLFRVADALMQAKRVRADDATEFEIPDLVPGKDLWGIPYQPRTR